MQIAVEDLKVIAYTPVTCPDHTWNLTAIPVDACAYYQCVKHGDPSKYDQYMDLWERYMDLWERRTPGQKAKLPYSDFSLMVESIRSHGMYRPEKFSDPLEVYAGTTVLSDGHHRAAIVMALFGPGQALEVRTSTDRYPMDLDLCKNPCR